VCESKIMMGIGNCFSQSFSFIRNVFVALLLCIGIPFGLLLCLPIYIFRWIVFHVAPFMRPDLGKMVTARSSFFAAEDVYKDPKNMAVASLVVNTNKFPTLDTVFEIANAKILAARTLTGEMQYPEFQQCLTTWLGFRFWKNNKYFKLEDYISLHDPEEITTEENLKSIQHKMILEPFKQDGCLWEIKLIWNYKEENCEELKSVVVFKCHHTLGDGYSLIKIFSKVADMDMKSLSVPNYPKISFWRKLTTLIRIPYDIAKFLAIWDENELHKKLTDSNKSNRSVVCLNSNKIPVRIIKEIRAKYGVCFGAVLNAGFTAAIRETMVSKGMKVPPSVHCMYPLPFPGHPEKLRNHM